MTVQRIAQWHKLGSAPEEISKAIPHLSLAQVHAALAYYYANLAQIDADLEAEASIAAEVERQHTGGAAR